MASSSPRRRELLSKLGIQFDVVEPQAKEFHESDPEKTVKKMAKMKAKEVFERFNQKDLVVIGSDTLVSLESNILGKPKDAEEAKKFLEKLSGNWHEVFTAVSFVHAHGQETFVSKTKVKFRNLSKELIEFYVSKFKPLDKAGAYGIQDFGAVFIEKIEGDFYTVMGFPLGIVWEYLYKKGWWNP